MTQYEMNKCSIDLPDSWQDRSINIFMRDPAGREGSITITGSKFESGMTLDGYVEADIENLMKAPGAKIKITHKEKGPIDGHDSRFLEMSTVVDGRYNEQLALYIDNNGYGIIAVYTCPSLIDEKLKKEVSAILQSIKIK